MHPTYLTTRPLEFTALGTGGLGTIHQEWPSYFPITLAHADGLHPGMFLARSIHDTDNPWVALVGVYDVQVTPEPPWATDGEWVSKVLAKHRPGFLFSGSIGCLGCSFVSLSGTSGFNEHLLRIIKEDEN